MSTPALSVRAVPDGEGTQGRRPPRHRSCWKHAFGMTCSPAWRYFATSALPAAKMCLAAMALLSRILGSTYRGLSMVRLCVLSALVRLYGSYCRTNP